MAGTKIDYFTFEASQIFGVPVCQVTEEQRQYAKRKAFAIRYGAGERTLAELLRPCTKPHKE